MTTSADLPATTPQPRSNPKQPTHWGSVWQLGCGGIIMLIAWSVALLFLLVLLFGFADPQAGQTISPEQGPTVFLYVWVGFFVGAVGLAGGILAGMRLAGKPATGNRFRKLLRFPLMIVLGALVVLFLLIGTLLSNLGDWALWLLPPIHTFVAVATVIVLIWIVIRGLGAGSLQRFAGVFSSGFLFAPSILLPLELILAVFVFIGVGLYLAANPDMVLIFDRLLTYLDTRAVPDITHMQEIAMPLLLDPPLLLWALFMLSVLVPLVEELFKPLGVWLLAGRNLTPREGFMLGVISGAGYALFENLTIVTFTADWGVIATARIGTAVMHMFTSGAMGWALATAWQDRKYLRLMAVYIGVVVIHGLWNGVEILRTFSTAIHSNQVVADAWIGPHWQWSGLIGLFMLALGVFGALLWSRRQFLPRSAAPHNEFKSEVEE